MAADITVTRNTAFSGTDEGSETAGFRYHVTPGTFHAGETAETAGKSIVIHNQTDYPIAVTFRCPIGKDAGVPIGAGQQQQFQLPAASKDDYSYFVMVNENGTIFRAHAHSNPKIVYP